ncbi:MAG: PQQ-dependent sugar dehydrogenase [Pseudomonadota bacterium]
MRGLWTLVFAVLLIFPALQAEPQTRDSTGINRVTIADSLEHPWAVAFLPDGSYLVTERPGRLLRIAEDGTKTEITGLPEIYNHGQGGLLDIALGPDFNDNGGWIYFSFAAPDKNESALANTEVARARYDLETNQLSALEVIFKAEPKLRGSNHFGSRLLFSPDGYLYITLGERFNYKEEAQNTDNHLGTIVRILPDGTVPADNPFIDQGDARPEIYSYGNRNVQGIARHPESGEIWFHEHGPRGGDEINILKAGANYGWPEVTYGVSYVGSEISDKTSAPGMEDPILQWTPSIAPSGMVFYTGDEFPEWQGDMLIGALAGQHLHRVSVDNGEIEQQILLEDFGKRIRDVAQSPDGGLYILTDEADGKLIRLTAK